MDTRLSVAVPDGASEQEVAEAAARRTHQKAFLSLHNAMDDVAALVTVKQREDAAPRLGLLVQLEEEEGPDGSQVCRSAAWPRAHSSRQCRPLPQKFLKNWGRLVGCPLAIEGAARTWLA